MSDARHRTFDVLGNVVNFLAFPDETEGKYCLMECVVPKGAGAPPNMHPGEMETFYVLEGEVGFHVDGRDVIAKPGDCLVVPDGGVHAFSGVAERSKILIVNAPGNMHEKFFTEIGVALPKGSTEPAPPSGPPDVPALVAKAAALGMTILAPEDA